MRKDQIITIIYKRSDLRNRIKELTKSRFEDAFCEFLAILCEMEAGKIEGLYARNELDLVLSKIISNQFKSKNSPFFKKYIEPDSKTVDLDHNGNNVVENIADDPSTEDYHKKLDQIEDKVKLLPKYDEILLNVYANDGKRMIEKTSKILKINRTYTRKRFKEIKDKLKNDLKDDQ